MENKYLSDTLLKPSDEAIRQNISRALFNQSWIQVSSATVII